MTVALDERGVLRDDAGRFASKACPRVYALLDTVSERPEGGYAVHAPRCPHGHFQRWASVNCKPCKAGR